MLVDKAGLYRLTSSAGHPWVDLDQPMRVHRAAGAGTLAGVVGTFANAFDFSALGALTSLAALTVPPALAYVRVGTATGWQRLSRWATTRKDRKKPPAPEALLTATEGITHVASDGLDLLRTPDGYLATALVTAPSAPDARDGAGERWGEVLAWAADAIPGIRLALSVVSGPVGREFVRVPDGLARAARAIAGQAVSYRSHLTVLIPSRTAQSAADSVRALLAQASTAGMTLTPMSAGDLSHLMAGQITGTTMWPKEVTPGKESCLAGGRHHAVARVASWPQRPVTATALDKLIQGDEEAIKTVTVLMTPYGAASSHRKYRRWARIHDGSRDERAARGQRATVTEVRSSRSTEDDFESLADGAVLVKTDAWILVTHPSPGAISSARTTLDTAAGAAGLSLDWTDGVHHRHLLTTTPLGVRL
ncbi:hypothetical protein [Streptomyces olivaceoviridis]|uniref:hypothetical protein n=1 Tax=Streptomyces olivaceoviridis TaxID=1921 RepID=UPI0037016C0C